MPDEPNPTPTLAPNPAPAPAAGIPEKFAGKPVEEVVKSYLELESKFGETSGKLKDLDAYSKIGAPKDISEALEWARNMKAALDRGLLVPKGTAQPNAPSPAEGKPWEASDWAFKSPAEQYQMMADHLQGQTKSYVDQLAQQYGKQIEGLTAQDAKQKSILLRAIKTAIKNPDVDPEELLGQAAELAAKSPEELLDMVMQARGNSPAARQSEIDKLVATKVAEKIQEYEAKQLADVTSAATPRRPGFAQASKGAVNRESENRAILEGLAKQGIRLV